MSVRVMSWVWESSRSEGIDRLVLLAIADSASDHGGDAWPSVQTLAAKAAVSARTVQRAVRSLVGLGELTVRSNAGRHGVNVYRVVMTPDRQSPPSDSHPDAESPRQVVTPSGCRDTPVTLTPPPRHADTRTVLEPSLPTQPPTTSSVTRTRGTRLPDGWTPDPQLVVDMRAEGIPDDLARRELPKFRDHWAAQAGARARKADWRATWRNWLRRAAEQQPRGSPNGRSTADQRVSDALAVAQRLRAQEAG